MLWRQQESKLQKKVCKYIESNYQYAIIHEYACMLRAINPKTNHALPYDNQILISDKDNLIIEVHGVQHYSSASNYTALAAQKHGITPEEELAEIQWRDEYKKQYAIAQGYYYLAIPYWTENDESYKAIIDNKIQEILNNTKLMCVS